MFSSSKVKGDAPRLASADQPSEGGSVKELPSKSRGDAVVTDCVFKISVELMFLVCLMVFMPFTIVGQKSKGQKQFLTAVIDQNRF